MRKQERISSCPHRRVELGWGHPNLGVLRVCLHPQGNKICSYHGSGASWRCRLYPREANGKKKKLGVREAKNA